MPLKPPCNSVMSVSVRHMAVYESDRDNPTTVTSQGNVRSTVISEKMTVELSKRERQSVQLNLKLLNCSRANKNRKNVDKNGFSSFPLLIQSGGDMSFKVVHEWELRPQPPGAPQDPPVQG